MDSNLFRQAGSIFTAGIARPQAILGAARFRPV